MTLTDDSFLSFVKDWIFAPLMALISWAWVHLNKRIDDVQNHANTEDNSIRIEVSRQRDVLAKIFDKLEEMRKEATQQHSALLTALYTGLAGKADK